METSLILHQAYPDPIQARAIEGGTPGYDWPAARDWFVVDQLLRHNAEGVQVINANTALTYSVFWACVRYIAQTLASVGWHVYERQEDGRTKLPIEDNIAWTLGMQANPEVNAFEFRQAILKDALCVGNGYAEIERTGGGRPLWLWRIDPGRVYVERDNRGKLYYRVTAQLGGQDTYLDPSNVYHLKGLGPDGLVGYSIVTMARKSIELGLLEEGYGSNFARRGPTPGGVLEIPGAMKKPDREEMRQSFERTYGGSVNAGRVVVLTGGAKFSPLTLSNQDAQFLESRTFQIDEICRWFGLPPHKVAELTHATFCLPAGELVLTEDGPQPIETINPGQRVWSRGKGGLTLAEVTRAGCTGSDPIITIRTTNRVLRCNARHPILCRRKRLVPSCRNVGGAKTVYGPCDVIWESEYVPAGELKVGDTLVTLAHLPDGGTLEACPSRLPSIGFMEFCGLLLGDGNLCGGRRKTGSLYVSIARDGKASYMDYYREVALAEFKKADGGTIHLDEGDRQTRFCSTVAVKELRAIGFGGTARTKSVPAWVWRLPESHRLALLRGFLDADGSCDKKGRLSYSSCNRILLAQMRLLCLSCGVPVTNLRLQEGETTLPNGERCPFRQWNFTCSDPGANRRIGSRTPHYVARLEAGQPFGRKDRKYPWHGGRGFNEPGFSLARIAHIDVGPAEPVYDLCVQGTHSFIAEGVIVHNSNIEEQERAVVSDCLLPWARRLECEADVKLYGQIQRGRRFTKLNLDSLQRGNSQTQTDTVTRKVTSALLTPNEGREYFDMNPITGGDTLLVQGAMVPLKSVTSTPQPPPAGPAAPPPEPNAPPDPNQPPADVVRVFGSLLTETYARLLRVEADKARRARGDLRTWAQGYYTERSDAVVAAAVRPVVEAFLLASGGHADAEVLAAQLAASHNAASRADPAPASLANGRAASQAADHLELLWRASR